MFGPFLDFIDYFGDYTSGLYFLLYGFIMDCMDNMECHSNPYNNNNIHTIAEIIHTIAKGTNNCNHPDHCIQLRLSKSGAENTDYTLIILLG